MGHGPDQIIEHAEHAAHASHDRFNTQVTISIAIIAAALAAVTILGHRAHNMVLLKQQQANRADAEMHNRWAQYQAHSGRSHLYHVFLDTAEFVATKPGSEKKQDEKVESWQKQEGSYEVKKKKAERDALEAREKSSALVAESDHWHHKAEWLDLGDLGLQFGVVLASMSILTKRRAFWFGGIAAAAIGFAVSMAGQFDLMPGGHHDKTEHKAEHKSEHKSETPAKH